MKYQFYSVGANRCAERLNGTEGYSNTLSNNALLIHNKALCIWQTPKKIFLVQPYRWIESLNWSTVQFQSKLHYV